MHHASCACHAACGAPASTAAGWSRGPPRTTQGRPWGWSPPPQSQRSWRRCLAGAQHRAGTNGGGGGIYHHVTRCNWHRTCMQMHAARKPVLAPGSGVGGGVGVGSGRGGAEGKGEGRTGGAGPAEPARVAVGRRAWGGRVATGREHTTWAHGGLCTLHAALGRHIWRRGHTTTHDKRHAGAVAARPPAWSAPRRHWRVPARSTLRRAMSVSVALLDLPAVDRLRLGSWRMKPSMAGGVNLGQARPGRATGPCR